MNKKSILLIGLGKFGKLIGMKLNELGNELMVVDISEERVNDLMPYATDGQIGDSTNSNFLNQLGINNYDVCIVAIGHDFQSSLETTSLLKELGAKKVISRAESDFQAKFLLKNGADEIIYPEKQLASWMAIRYSSDHIFDYIELDKDIAIFEIEVPENWLNKSIAQIDIRKNFNINIVAIKIEGKVNPVNSAEFVLTKDCHLLILGDYKAVKKCFN